MADCKEKAYLCQKGYQKSVFNNFTVVYEKTISMLEILEAVRGKGMTPNERQKMAIDLAGQMLEEAGRIQRRQERKKQHELARMMRDPRGKAFTICMTDQCFRSNRSQRIADQLVYLLKIFGIPRYLSWIKQLQLGAFQLFGKVIPWIFSPLASAELRRETSRMILPGEPKALTHHLKKRRKENVRLNLNHLGEAILGEEEAQRRLGVYVKDLENPLIHYVSVKISTIFSQINLLSWDQTLDQLQKRLKILYRAARQTHKFVNLDMEEYRDLHLTVELFKQALSDPEFHDFEAGIVLQAYLPETYTIQKELTEWAMQRVKDKGAPIKIRIVKGANLAMEHFEASLRGWPQAIYQRKIEVDANYKRMVAYGCIPAHAKAVHLGVASHNLFDIAYALLLRAEHGVEREVSFEMLEGMAGPLRRVVHKLSNDILLYCPIATKDDFHNAIAYLIRRLDENTGHDNFLRAVFGLKPNTPEWDTQVALFKQSFEEQKELSFLPRRTQNRNTSPESLDAQAPFDNEADTDFSLAPNRVWVKSVVAEWKDRTISPPKEALWPEVDQMLKMAKASEQKWAHLSTQSRCDLLTKVAQTLRERRADLIGVMLRYGHKTPPEADGEISEAIDFAEYYRRSRIKMEACRDLSWKPKGTVLVASPWNFPVSIPAGGILAALASGNCVVFKPAPEAVIVGWVLVQAFWEAGIPRDVLHFLTCPDEPVGTQLIQDLRINSVILTGATATARLFLKARPGLDLFAETGGKNGIIVTGMADRDLAIKDLVQSAFGHSGQKCSAASLAILEAEVYDDPNFRRQLRDAVMSLPVGPAWDLSSKIVPLIREPGRDLLRGLTTLDRGETWLVKPKQDSRVPNLWSPGVKWGVREGSFMHQTELFGPVVGVMRAKNLNHAIHLANGTPYGLTSGLQSLDEREQKEWLQKIEAGNLYINRSITGAIVRRQPFGGFKGSGFGPGAKAGGPNYVPQFAVAHQSSLPQEKAAVGPIVDNLTNFIKKLELSKDDLSLWYASVANYAFWAKRFQHEHDPSKILGQDNFLTYRPYSRICFRLQSTDQPIDILRVCAAALLTETPMQISYTRGQTKILINDMWHHLMPIFRLVPESEEQFIERVSSGAFARSRLLSDPSTALNEAAAQSACHLAHAPVLANGRFELLHYLHEVSISHDYHRYGNLGIREGESRKPIL
jgi:RHH-type proline utilization regulon transcriptional repressor/proline dehydrogenase/delta 1-pyrroline-5-carboxylate dehydrogenase